jgi:DNA topoisomerase VI subunit B
MKVCLTLVLDSKALPLIETTKESSDRNPPAIILDPTGNNEVDQAVNAIMNKVVTPVTIKPKCFFDTQTPDDNRLAYFLAQLDSTEV